MGAFFFIPSRSKEVYFKGKIVHPRGATSPKGGERGWGGGENLEIDYLKRSICSHRGAKWGKFFRSKMKEPTPKFFLSTKKKRICSKEQLGANKFE